MPLRVGLITSEGSAAYHDFVDELRARRTRGGSAWSTSRCRARRAAQRIKWALGQLAQLDLDVVVLARGGGSRADLAPFDTELVARAIAAMAVPVITGVGHETDRSVADEVAYTACKTPTACAQLLVRPGRRASWARSTRRRSGWRRGRGSAWPSPRASSTTPRAACTPERAGGGGPCEHARLDRAHGRLDELARRRTVDLTRARSTPAPPAE